MIELADSKQPPSPECAFCIVTENYYNNWYTAQNLKDYCRSHGIMTPAQERNRAIVEKIQIVQWAIQSVLTTAQQDRLFGAPKVTAEQITFQMKRGKSLIYNLFTWQNWNTVTTGGFVDSNGIVHGCCTTQEDYTDLKRLHDSAIEEIAEYLATESTDSSKTPQDFLLSHLYQRSYGEYKGSINLHASIINELQPKETMDFNSELFKTE